MYSLGKHAGKDAAFLYCWFGNSSVPNILEEDCHFRKISYLVTFKTVCSKSLASLGLLITKYFISSVNC